MKSLPVRLWVLALALGFFALWCASAAMAFSLASDAAGDAAAAAAAGSGLRTIGILAWCLVGAGVAGVAAAVLGSALQPRGRRRSSYRAGRFPTLRRAGSARYRAARRLR